MTTEQLSPVTIPASDGEVTLVSEEYFEQGINMDKLLEKVGGTGAKDEDLDFLLEHPELIPEDWKGISHLFVGSKRSMPFEFGISHRVATCLEWRGNKWYKEEGKLGNLMYFIKTRVVLRR